MPKQPTDPRSTTPQIQAYRKIVGRYPHKLLYDDVISAVGETNEQREADMLTCYKEWIARGYNPNSVKWLEWLTVGIPTRINKLKKQVIGPMTTQTVDELNAALREGRM